MEEEIKKLKDLLINGRSVKGLRIFLVSEDYFVRVKSNRWSINYFSEAFGFLEFKKVNRDNILSAFAKLEFMVDECIKLHFFCPGDKKLDNFDVLVGKLPFRQRIGLLKKFEGMTSSVENKFSSLAKTRNQVAHEWDLKFVDYKNNKVSDSENFLVFKADLKCVFEYLVEKIKLLQDEKKYGEYLKSIISEMCADPD